MDEKDVLPPNKSKIWALLSFPSCDWLYFFQSRRVVSKLLEPSSPWPAVLKAWNAVMSCGSSERTTFTGKKFLFISKGMSKET